MISKLSESNGIVSLVLTEAVARPEEKNSKEYLLDRKRINFYDHLKEGAAVTLGMHVKTNVETEIPQYLRIAGSNNTIYRF